MAFHYLDFDLEIGKGNGGVYPVKANWLGNQAYYDAQLQWADDPVSLRKAIEEAVLDSPLRRRRSRRRSSISLSDRGRPTATPLARRRSP